MKRFVRLVLIGVALVGSLGGAAWADPEWATACGLDFWNAAECEGHLEFAQAESEKLDRLGAALTNRMRIKQGLLDDLARGRKTFREVLAQWWLLNDQYPGVSASIARNHPGATEMESQARNLITCVLIASSTDPTLADELERRLGAELEVLIVELCEFATR